MKFAIGWFPLIDFLFRSLQRPTIEEGELIVDDKANSTEVQNHSLQSHKPYTCDKCNISFRTVQDAFSHESIMNHKQHHVGTGEGNMSVTAKNGIDRLNAYKCKDCPAVCLDTLVLQVHQFLHQDLTYFFCSECDYVFGLPSKLKRHYFLTHDKILSSEHENILDTQRRAEITVKIQEYITLSDVRKVEMVDNFVDASLDAKLIHDEITMNEEVENIPLTELGTILNKYLLHIEVDQ